MRNKIELLAPAKTLDIGMAAINFGADAVYIGGPGFGAREKASNSIADIERLCRHAALFDAKVYVTLNTILFDHELEQARQIAYECWNAGADALIIQDMALLNMDMPPIALHASTQCNNMTAEKVKFLEDVGFRQVVLGRELSLAEIADIRRQTSVALEFFVHGSLCVSINGQCYMSHHIGNRSANRGACAQPCRLPWTLVDDRGRKIIENRHLLSLKDLNNSEHLEQLIEAGISSFKIEGRMKEADYVKNITAFYRKALDSVFERHSDWGPSSRGRCNVAFEPVPEKSFSRGFTDYFINGRQPGIGSPFTPKSMGEEIGKATQVTPNHFTIAAEKELHNGDGLCFLDKDHVLQGFRVNKVENNRVFPDKRTTVFNGVSVFRNFDIEWQRTIENAKWSRKMDLTLTLGETDNGYFLKGSTGGTECLVETEADKIAAINTEKSLENIKKKIMQWGDTVFNPISLETQFAQTPLIQSSLLGQLKRMLNDKLSSKLVETHIENRETFIKPTKNAVFPEAELTYLDNVANSKAKEFYMNHRAVSVEFCPEVEAHGKPLKVMTTKHCIRFENGMCCKQTGLPSTDLFIENDKGRFRLHFDCKNCRMEIFAD